jgi:cation transporter-like permease
MSLMEVRNANNLFSRIFKRKISSYLFCSFTIRLDECPVEPTISFGEALRDRAYWLVGLLIMQSFSGIILSRNEALLADHPVIIYFLTMLVGAGGKTY